MAMSQQAERCGGPVTGGLVTKPGPVGTKRALPTQAGQQVGGG